MTTLEERIKARLEALRASREELLRQVAAHDVAIGELEHIMEPEPEQAEDKDNDNQS